MSELLQDSVEGSVYEREMIDMVYQQLAICSIVLNGGVM